MSVLVSRRAFCSEGFSRERLEQKAMRILVIVGCDFPENGKYRKSKVFLAIFVSQELVSTLVVS
jgi:hypothetical protein